MVRISCASNQKVILESIGEYNSYPTYGFILSNIQSGVFSLVIEFYQRLLCLHYNAAFIAYGR